MQELTRRAVVGGAISLAAIPLISGTAVASERERTRSNPSRESAAPARRFLHSAAAMRNGLVLVTGGYHVGDSTRSRVGVPPSTSAQLYDPLSDRWFDVAPLTLGRARHASVELPDGRVAVLGGFHSFAVDSVELYDPVADSWSVGEPLPMPMYDHAAVLAGSSVVLVGGHSGAAAVVIDGLAGVSVARP